MNYHIARNNQLSGTCSKEEVLARYNNGAILPSDLLWTQGMAGWQSAWMVLGAPAISGGLPPPLDPLGAAGRPARKRAPVKAAWICFAAAVALSLVPIPGAMFLAIPMALASFVLAIIVIIKSDAKTGILLLLCNLIIGPLSMMTGWLLTTFVFVSSHGIAASSALQ